VQENLTRGLSISFQLLQTTIQPRVSRKRLVSLFNRILNTFPLDSRFLRSASRCRHWAPKREQCSPSTALPSHLGTNLQLRSTLEMHLCTMECIESRDSISLLHSSPFDRAAGLLLAPASVAATHALVREKLLHRQKLGQRSLYSRFTVHSSSSPTPLRKLGCKSPGTILYYLPCHDSIDREQ
jgi:hypothetical protein